jgi:hypothetical protein
MLAMSAHRRERGVKLVGVSAKSDDGDDDRMKRRQLEAC